ncbi:hypothetical protein FKM82_030028 [Ascaphus truei]
MVTSGVRLPAYPHGCYCKIKGVVPHPVPPPLLIAPSCTPNPCGGRSPRSLRTTAVTPAMSFMRRRCVAYPNRWPPLLVISGNLGGGEGDGGVPWFRSVTCNLHSVFGRLV